MVLLQNVQHIGLNLWFIVFYNFFGPLLFLFFFIFLQWYFFIRNCALFSLYLRFSSSSCGSIYCLALHLFWVRNKSESFFDCVSRAWDDFNIHLLICVHFVCSVWYSIFEYTFFSQAPFVIWLTFDFYRIQSMLDFLIRIRFRWILRSLLQINYKPKSTRSA